MPKVNTSISIDADLKASAQKLFAELGLDLSSAVTLFLRQSVEEEAIPFRICKRPNAETLKALNEGDSMLNDKNSKRFHSVDELFEDLDS